MTAHDLVKQNPCPPLIGRHGWIWFMACMCHEQDIPREEAESAIRAGLSRAETHPAEVSDTVRNAYARAEKKSSQDMTVLLNGVTIRRSELKYHLPSLEEAVRDVPPIDPDYLEAQCSGMNWDHDPVDLMCLWAEREGECIMAFDRMDSKVPAVMLRKGVDGNELLQPTSKKVGCEWQLIDDEDSVRQGLVQNEWPLGFWWLPQPVDGQWSGDPIDPTRRSCRSYFNVLDFRWLVLESDQAPADLWLRYLVTLPGVGLITTSGGKSIHALIRVDQPTREAYNKLVERYKYRFIRLGADPLSLSAVRLTRLPGCFRAEKNLRQTLLYLNPNAKAGGEPIWKT